MAASHYSPDIVVANDFKSSFVLALALHVLVVASGYYVPEIFKAKRKIPDTYTIDLISLPEPAAEVPSPPPAQPVQKETSKEPETLIPKAVKKKVAIPPPEKAPAPRKKISLKPLKRKIKKKLPPKKEVKKRDETVSRTNERKLAEARRRQELLAKKAELARQALEEERKLLTGKTAPLTTSATTTRTSSRAAGNQGVDKVEAMYYANVKNKLSQYWALPTSIERDKDLLAIVVITIAKNGEVANILFEKSSGNIVFDRFVKETILAANPMPPLPALMKRQRFEIGLKFRPSGLQ